MSADQKLNQWQKRDAKVLWHPYTQMKTAPPPIPIVRGNGAKVYDEDENAFIDAISSWWVTLHGHANPHIIKKVSEQLNRLEQVIFAGFTHPPAVELAEKLLGVLPDSFQKIFYTDNGSTAVEAAVKMALQYWFNRGKTRLSLIAFKNGYHGDTFGAMSVSGRSVFTKPFEPLLFDVDFIEAPVTGRESESIEQLNTVLNKKKAAAFIFEPLVQGAGGMIMYKPEPLNKMIEMCRHGKVLTIADEVFTGFGRTGSFFAIDQLAIPPDLICLSKGLTGGTLPLGVTACSESVTKPFYSDDSEKMLFHGHSFSANPLACAAALASFDLMEDPGTWEKIKNIQHNHHQFAEKITGHPQLTDCRQTGTILALEIKTPDQTGYLNSLRNWLTDFFIRKHILMRPLGNVIYVVPPYCITNKELGQVYRVIEEALDQLGKQ